MWLRDLVGVGEGVRDVGWVENRGLHHSLGGLVARISSLAVVAMVLFACDGSHSVSHVCAFSHFLVLMWRLRFAENCVGVDNPAYG